jgi:hypothetical protein
MITVFKPPETNGVAAAANKLLDFASVDRFYNRLSGREMPIQGADADAGAARDFFQAHIQSDVRKPCLGGVDE